MSDFLDAGKDLAVSLENEYGCWQGNAIALFAVALFTASHENPDEYLEKVIRALRMQVAALQFAAESGESN